MLHRNKTRLRHMLFVLRRTRSQTLDSGCGSALVEPYLVSVEVLEVLGSLSFGDALDQDCNRKVGIHSIGLSACNRHHHVLKEICARLSRNGCTPPQTPGKNNVFEFVLRNTLQVFSVMKVLRWPFVSAFVPPPRWSHVEQSTHSSYHVRCGFGWGRINSCERRPRSMRYGEKGSVTRLRQRSTGASQVDSRESFWELESDIVSDRGEIYEEGFLATCPGSVRATILDDATVDSLITEPVELDIHPWSSDGAGLS